MSTNESSGKIIFNATEMAVFGQKGRKSMVCPQVIGNGLEKMGPG